MVEICPCERPDCSSVIEKRVCFDIADEKFTKLMSHRYYLELIRGDKKEELATIPGPNFFFLMSFERDILLREIIKSDDTTEWYSILEKKGLVLQKDHYFEIIKERKLLFYHYTVTKGHRPSYEEFLVAEENNQLAISDFIVEWRLANSVNGKNFERVLVKLSQNNARRDIFKDWSRLGPEKKRAIVAYYINRKNIDVIRFLAREDMFISDYSLMELSKKPGLSQEITDILSSRLPER